MVHLRRFMALLVSFALIVSSTVPAYSTCGCEHSSSGIECCQTAPRAPEPVSSCCSAGAAAARHHECSHLQIVGNSKSLQYPPCQQDQFFGDPIAATSTGPRVERTEDLPVLVTLSLVPELGSSEPKGSMHSRPPPGALASIPFFLLLGSFLS